jgi:hypothetical protein
MLHVWEEPEISDETLIERNTEDLIKWNNSHLSGKTQICTLFLLIPSRYKYIRGSLSQFFQIVRSDFLFKIMRLFKYLCFIFSLLSFFFYFSTFFKTDFKFDDENSGLITLTSRKENVCENKINKLVYVYNDLHCSYMTVSYNNYW